KGGQPEHMCNTPLWGLDNYIYCGNYQQRFKLQGNKWITDVTKGPRGQWGLTKDDVGRFYYNYNSDLLRGDLVPTQYLSRSPFFNATGGSNVKVMEDQVVWPSHPTPGVNRGYNEASTGDGALRPDGTLIRCTATCGPGVYRGDLFPSQFYGNVFIPE